MLPLAWGVDGCASPTPVGLYGARPESGDWARAHELTMRARALARAPGSDRIAAEDLLWRAVEADPAHGPAYLHLGTILEPQGKLDGALWAYAWANRLMPGNPGAELRLHDLLDRMGSDPSREPIGPIPGP